MWKVLAAALQNGRAGLRAGAGEGGKRAKGRKRIPRAIQAVETGRVSVPGLGRVLGRGHPLRHPRRVTSGVHRKSRKRRGGEAPGPSSAPAAECWVLCAHFLYET